MKAGQFNIHEYLEKLYEESTPMMDGGEGLSNAEGIIIPDTNKKSYDWLKKEYHAKQTEVKVEISGSGASFKPGYDLQTNLDSVKDFKPGMFGEVKTADTLGAKKEDNASNTLDPNKKEAGFKKGEGDKSTEEKSEKSETKPETKDIKDKQPEKPKADGAEVKKMDLKTKKTEGEEKEEKPEKEEKEEKPEKEEKEDKDDKEEKDDSKK
jgi:hypothetical protein